MVPDVDLQVESGFAPFFSSLSAEEKLIRFFERKEDFFTVHGKDATFVAETVYQTTTVIKHYGSLESCSLSKQGAQQLVKDLLLVQGFKVEFWTQEGRNWVMEKMASPGNLKQVEDFLFANSDLHSSPVIASVWIDARSTGKSLLIQQSVKECVLPKDTGTNYDLKVIAGILERCEIVCTYTKTSRFNADYIAPDLKKLTNLDIGLLEVEFDCAMKSVACLIIYLDLLSDDANLGAYKINQFNLNNYMKLDASAVKALNLVPGPKDGKKNNNLFGLLNRCKTAQGSRLLGQWIKQPLMNLEEIKTRQDLVQVFFTDTLLLQNVQEVSLKTFPDLHRLGKKFQRGKAGLQDVVRIYQVVKSLPVLIAYLKEYRGEFVDLIIEHFVSKLQRIAESLLKFEELVETTIDLNASDNHEFIIKPDYDASLQEVRSQMDSIYSQLKPEAKLVADELGVEFEKKLKFENNPQFGYHMRLSRNDASKIRGNGAFIELKTLKAGVMFTTSTLRRLSSEYTDLGKEYGKLQAKIAKEVVSITATYFPIFEEANEVVAVMDVLAALADAAFQAPTQYVRPLVTINGNLDLKAGRHPCVEVQDDVSFIENDTLLQRNSLFSIITGPNMGGKSTYIRQIGVICLMAQIGCFVPCQEATIPISDAILARVGANDTQLKGISTFMAEMLETAAILRVATKRSLIIIDELGRGTSTKDGFGLAWAIAEYIVKNVSCFTLFATHYHEITSLEDKFDTVRNYHVQAKISDSDSAKSLTLLYKIVEGACDQSFGIHVAKLCDFPDFVIEMAKRKSAELEGFKDDSTKRWKSTPQEITRGEQKIKQFMQKFKQLKGFNGLEELRSEVRKEMEIEPFIYEVVNEF